MDTEMNVQLDERLRILKMVEAGKISPGEGASLLSAIGESRKADYSNQRSEWRSTVAGTRFFRVRVTDLHTGRSKATVTIPMGLMDWGLKIGAQFAPEIADLDLEELTEMLRKGADGKLVDVIDDEDGEHVEIFID